MTHPKTLEELPCIPMPESAMSSPGPFLAHMYEYYGPIFRVRSFNMMHPAFTLAFMERYPLIMQRRVREQLEGWEIKGEIGLHEEIRRIVFVVLAETLAGLSAGPEVKRYHELFTDLFTIGQSATSANGTSRSQIRQIKQALYTLLQPKIQERRERPADDILGMLVRARDDQGQAMSDEQLIAHINFLVGTGHETTSSLSAWSLYLLTLHPNYMQRVLDEQKQLHRPGVETTLNDIKQMVVLDNALSEAERLYPPISAGPRGVVETFEFNGYTIPAGSFVCYSIAATHLLSHIFTNPLLFDPDRFLAPREEHKKTPYALVGFGGGPRICIATNFASVQIKALISPILKTHRLDALPDQKPVQHYRGIGIPRNGIQMRVVRL